MKGGGKLMTDYTEYCKLLMVTYYNQRQHLYNEKEFSKIVLLLK